MLRQEKGRGGGEAVVGADREDEVGRRLVDVELESEVQPRRLQRHDRRPLQQQVALVRRAPAGLLPAKTILLGDPGAGTSNPPGDRAAPDHPSVAGEADRDVRLGVGGRQDEAPDARTGLGIL